MKQLSKKQLEAAVAEAKNAHDTHSSWGNAASTSQVLSRENVQQIIVTSDLILTIEKLDKKNTELQRTLARYTLLSTIFAGIAAIATVISLYLVAISRR